jgi:hypothetical protein
MSRSRRSPRHAPWRPRCEGLEHRLALSGLPSFDGLATVDFSLFDLHAFAFSFPADPMQVVATQPASGSVLSGAVTSLAVEFDRPVDPWSLLGDVQLAMIHDDGSLTWVVDGSVHTIQGLDPLDPARLVVTLDAPLVPGRYQMSLSAGSTIAAADGSPLDPSILDGPLAEFTIATPGITAAIARDLGVVGPVPRDVPGTLDLRTNPNDVALYRIELTPDHSRWRLGVEVSAQRQGSPLDAALTLFSAQGQPLATAELGRRDAPRDPYLFAGLTPGTYYVGVSGTGNLPTRPGGYSLVTGDPGQVVQQQEGGPFTLSLVADPAETPTSMLAFQLDRADPYRNEPTGFAIRFSGPIRVAGQDGQIFSTVTDGLELVDDQGRSWPIAGTAYDEATATLHYVFRQRLPQGNYTLRVAPSGGLSDLSGQPVTGRIGRTGILARFAVPAAKRAADPTDLGPFYPDEMLEGRAVTLELAPGESRTYRYTNLYSDLYQVGLRVEGGPVAVSFVGGAAPDAPLSARDLFGTDAPDGEWSTALVAITEGPYQIRVENRSDRPATVALSVGTPGFGWESVLENGVGQGPALGLRLVAPSAVFASPATYASHSDTPDVSAPGALAALPAAFGSEGIAVPGGPAVIPDSIADTSPSPSLVSSPNGLLASSAATGLVGLPAESGGLPSALPGGTGAATVLAAAGTAAGLPVVTVGQGSGSTGLDALGTGAPLGDLATVSEALAGMSAAIQVPGVPQRPAHEQAHSTTRDEPIDGLLAQLDDLLPPWISAAKGDPREQAAAEEPQPVPGAELALLDAPASDEEGKAAGPVVDTRLGLGLVAALTLHLHGSAARRARREARRRGGPASAPFASRLPSGPRWAS